MLQGSYTALVTPFKNGEIDYYALEKLIEFQLENKTDGILLCGTTAESPALAGDEKWQLIRFCMRKIDKKVPVMIGTGTNNLNSTVAQTRRAFDAGADSALVITPYYNKPTQNGMKEYFSRIAEKTEIPLVIYNVPGRTGVNINAETVAWLASNITSVKAVKEASGSLTQASKIIKETADDFTLFSGEDALNLPLMAVGAKGCISVTSNIIPEKVHDLIKLSLDGDFEKARKIHHEIEDLNEIMFVETNPIPVKEALALMGYIEPLFRMPLCNLAAENKKKLINVLKVHNLIK
ncbi:MAG: 4-hydroxy-tetrahydrodipicolinate synthase [Candidatus Cloacimonadota bacterium]|nr:MAG: 4-hydroxy-tetrahydrodipicolinate synthase [Candidatus Cloacimonadota bacterium]